jgi:hypothetical protein
MSSSSGRFDNLRDKGPGGFSRRDWYSSRAFNRLPSGPVVPRQTYQDGEAAYCLGCCLLSYRANGEPNSSSEGVMCLWIMYLGQAFLLTAHPSIAVSPRLSMWSRVSRNPKTSDAWMNILDRRCR